MRLNRFHDWLFWVHDFYCRCQSGGQLVMFTAILIATKLHKLFCFHWSTYQNGCFQNVYTNNIAYNDWSSQNLAVLFALSAKCCMEKQFRQYEQREEKILMRETEYGERFDLTQMISGIYLQYFKSYADCFSCSSAQIEKVVYRNSRNWKVIVTKQGCLIYSIFVFGHSFFAELQLLLLKSV